jgi:hypothetical protein
MASHADEAGRERPHVRVDEDLVIVHFVKLAKIHYLDGYPPSITISAPAMASDPANVGGASRKQRFGYMPV